MVGINLQCLVVAFDRVLWSLQSTESDSAVAEGVGISWIDRQGLVVAIECFLWPVERVKRIATVAEGIGMVRVDGERAVDQREAVLVTTLLARDHAQEVKSLHVIRIRSKDCPIKSLRVGQIASLMRHNGLLYCVLQ